MADGQINETIFMPNGSVSLLLVIDKPAAAPGIVENVQTETYSGLWGQERLVTWDALQSYAIRSYDVFFSTSLDGTYRSLNVADLLGTALIHAGYDPTQPAFYQIIARDYWGRTSLAAVPDPASLGMAGLLAVCVGLRRNRCRTEVA